ncbi:peptide chain release factor N(5)-glutamine methyltransferase [Qipengyuania zhejiangensis]|uniref:peptide chain release factor N(5)-glutamine methyltransferase n=1 Tax=Qipengyuania zhejiangensis TaxID=3077782 RepID=UPI002D787594|nr:peptide chain release factor N(5)-glutamine methyltransferase [Qipengyuania sp. Z2]
MTETVAGAIRVAADRLAATSGTARLDAELLMGHVLGVSRSDLLVFHLGRDVLPHRTAYERLVERRLRHEPVAYLVNTQEFYGLRLAVTPDVLIPRGDSEVLVDAALDIVPDAGRVLDMGTGSGALLLAYLANAPQARGVGIDASPGALEVATANCERLGLSERARFLLADWTTKDWDAPLGQFDLVLCNPPYVEDDAPLDRDVREYEPASALFAGPQGLDDYRVLVPQLGKLLLPGGVAILEIGATQGDAVGDIARESGFAVAVRKDLGGRPRALVLRPS